MSRKEYYEGAVRAHVSLQGDADILTSDLLNLRQSNIQKRISITVRVKYAGNRYFEWYSIPEIENGNVKAAHDALEFLWRQRAITAEQHTKIEQAIYDAEAFTSKIRAPETAT